MEEKELVIDSRLWGKTEKKQTKSSPRIAKSIKKKQTTMQDVARVVRSQINASSPKFKITTEKFRGFGAKNTMKRKFIPIQQNTTSRPIKVPNILFIPKLIPSQPSPSTLSIPPPPPPIILPFREIENPIVRVIENPEIQHEIYIPRLISIDEEKRNEDIKKASEIKQRNNLIPPKQARRKKTIRKKFKIGKQPDGIFILIPNKESQQLLFRAEQKLKEDSISMIRAELMKRKLILSGSTAPEDLLRQMYLDSSIN